MALGPLKLPGGKSDRGRVVLVVLVMGVLLVSRGDAIRKANGLASRHAECESKHTSLAQCEPPPFRSPPARKGRFVTLRRLRSSTRRLAVRWNRARALSSNPLCYKLMKPKGRRRSPAKSHISPSAPLARSLITPSPHRTTNKTNAPDTANHTTNNKEKTQTNK